MTTQIEWCTEVWNPVTGCTKVSAGCQNCYAERMSKRLRGRFGYPADDPFRVTLHPDRLDQPLRWRKPRRVFVCSMGDLFHEDVPDHYRLLVWGIMAACPDHTFQVLTKRPAAMASWLRWLSFTPVKPRALIALALLNDLSEWSESLWMRVPDEWPLPNVELGTSVEDQPAAIERLPQLLECPAAVRFVSCEPMLGAADLTRLQLVAPEPPLRPGVWLNALTGHVIGPDDMLPASLDWVIVGGESGPGARPCDVENIRSIVGQCRDAGVPCFVKQLGSYPRQNAPGRINIPMSLNDSKGGDPAEWPADLRVREFPSNPLLEKEAR